MTVTAVRFLSVAIFYVSIGVDFVLSADRLTVEHNGSIMILELGSVSEDTAEFVISYSVPRRGIIEQGVAQGTNLVQGFAYLDQSFITGIAHVFKKGCAPLSYNVIGVFNNGISFARQKLRLFGLTPHFAKTGCQEGFTSTRPQELLFAPHP
jgi:hypothetical protein